MLLPSGYTTYFSKSIVEELKVAMVLLLVLPAAACYSSIPHYYTTKAEQIKECFFFDLAKKKWGQIIIQ